jgi:hypothetical protein
MPQNCGIFWWLRDKLHGKSAGKPLAVSISKIFMWVCTDIKNSTSPAGCKKWNEPQIRRFSRQGHVLNIPHSGEFSKYCFCPEAEASTD